MHLYELAMELGERSADLADAAPSLGLADISPTSDLTPEQVAVFRARYAKAPVGAPASSGAAYQAPATWGPPGGGGAPLPPPPPSRGSGMPMGQVVLIAGAIVAVIGLFAFMAKNGGPDQKRLEQIASTPPDDSTITTGPDGKPLTEKQLADIRTYQAAEAEQKARTCALLDDLNDTDVWGREMPTSIVDLPGMTAYMQESVQQAMPLYDQIAAAVPDQADNARKAKEFAAQVPATFAQAVDADSLRANGAALGDRAIAAGWYDAARALSNYSNVVCGFPLSVPT
ncbi:MAG: hypothetical protein ACTHN0_03050 [Aquihabitans sp.]